jgi:hypothetical protein
MSLFSRLFGGGASANEAEPVAYEGFHIFPEPIREGSQHRIAARIEKDVGGVPKTYQLIRADTLGDREFAVTASVNKAKQMIDEQGERLFD